MNKARTFLKLSKTLRARVVSSLKNNLASCVLEFQINLDQTPSVVLYFPGEHSLNFPTLKKMNSKRKVKGNLDYELQVEIFMPFAINPKRDSKSR